MFTIESMELSGISWGWIFCRAGFLIYLIILSIMDIRRKKLNLKFLLSGTGLLIVSRFCGEKTPAVMAAAGAAAGMIFLAVSRGTRESLGYGDSILIMITGGFLGFWELLSLLAGAFSMAAVFAGIMMIRKKFHRKTAFPFVPFLTAAYAGGMMISGISVISG